MGEDLAAATAAEDSAAEDLAAATEEDSAAEDLAAATEEDSAAEDLAAATEEDSAAEELAAEGMGEEAGKEEREEEMGQPKYFQSYRTNSLDRRCRTCISLETQLAPENMLCAVVAAVPVHEEMSWLNAEAE